MFVFAAATGVGLWWWFAGSKQASVRGFACPPVRTSLAAISLVAHPTAKTFATVGPGAGAFTNVFAHAGLASAANGPADLVFVSGDVSRETLVAAWGRCATNGLLAVHLDVRGKSFAAFGRELSSLPDQDWRLWFPGRSDALVTLSTDVPRLTDMMGVFVREGLFTDFARAGIDSLAGLLASYVGTRGDALPVCGAVPGEVVPECFVTKEIPAFDWIDLRDVDADIRDRISSEIVSMQNVRRIVLRGDIRSREGNRDAAMELWTLAVASTNNPNDTLILERLCLLDVNVETFLRVGNLPLAAQCLETMVCLRPKDANVARRLALVFRQMGRRELADAVSKRADEIVRARLNNRTVDR